jgi:hypothetical protein
MERHARTIPRHQVVSQVFPVNSPNHGLGKRLEDSRFKALEACGFAYVKQHEGMFDDLTDSVQLRRIYKIARWT